MSQVQVEKKIRAKERYEVEKRVSKPVSFNQFKDAKIHAISKKLRFSEWVKCLLENFSSSEISLAKDDLKFVPSSLVEHALEKGYFDIDEYLASKGKKIIDIPQHTPDQNFTQPDYDNYSQEVYPYQ